MVGIQQSIHTVVKLGLIAGCAYALYQWAPVNTGDDGSVEFAREACADETRARFDVSGLRVYDVKQSNDGFVVNISVTLGNSNAAKVVCLTNRHGSVRDVMIDER